jgi:hypothetical protein
VAAVRRGLIAAILSKAGVIATLEHDPEKLQTFRTRSCGETSD